MKTTILSSTIPPFGTLATRFGNYKVGDSCLWLKSVRPHQFWDHCKSVGVATSQNTSQYHICRETVSKAIIECPRNMWNLWPAHQDCCDYLFQPDISYGVARMSYLENTPAEDTVLQPAIEKHLLGYSTKS